MRIKVRMGRSKVWECVMASFRTWIHLSVRYDDQIKPCVQYSSSRDELTGPLSAWDCTEKFCWAVLRLSWPYGTIRALLWRSQDNRVSFAIGEANNQDLYPCSVRAGLAILYPDLENLLTCELER